MSPASTSSTVEAIEMQQTRSLEQLLKDIMESEVEDVDSDELGEEVPGRDRGSREGIESLLLRLRTADESSLDQFCTPENVTTLTRLARKHPGSGLTEITSLLVIRSNENAGAFCNSDGGGLLTSWMNCGNFRQRTSALKTLAIILFKYPELIEFYSGEKLVESLVGLLKMATENANAEKSTPIIQNALLCIHHLLKYPELKEVLISFGVVRPLLTVLDVENDIIKYLGVRNIELISINTDAVTEVWKLKGLPKLVRLLDSADPKTARAAIRVINTVMIHRPPSRTGKQKDYGARSKLVETLESQDSRTRTLSMVALTNIMQVSSAYECQHISGMARLAKMMSSSDQEVKRFARSTFRRATTCNLAELNIETLNNSHVADRIRELTGFLQCEDLSTQRFAVTQLRKCISNNQEAKEVFRAVGGVERLMPIVESADVKVRRNAVAALADSIYGNFQAKMVCSQQNGVVKLLDLLENSDRKTQRYAVLALANVTSLNTPTREQCRNHGGLIKLVHVLSSPDRLTVRYATMAMGNLFRDSYSARTQCLSNGALNMLVSLLESEDMLTTRWSALALSLISENNNAAEEEVHRSGGTGLLLTLLDTEDGETQRAAIATLSRLIAHIPAARDECQTSAGIARLEALLESECRETRRHTATALLSVSFANLAMVT